jgi:hypothetical protein
MRNGQFEATERKFATAADVKRVRFATLPLAVRRNFVIAEHRRAGAFRDCNRIAEMIAMSVRDENEIGLDLIGGDRREWVTGEKWINDERSFRCFDEPARMTVPR